MADRPHRQPKRQPKRQADAKRPSKPDAVPLSAGAASRRVAIEALLRIEKGGAYANLVLPELLARSQLADEDRRFVTEMVYGTTRMRRACDHLVDRFLLDEVDHQVRAALRLGAYQLAFLRTPAHAGVDATVGAVKGRGRSVVNAVLRRVAAAPVEFPDRATELSYPDWIIDRISTDFGPETAEKALLAMNQGASPTIRSDGYVQDAASQQVVAAVGALPGELVIDLCAAPGGKATGIAESEVAVIAAELRPKRAGLIRQNVERLGMPIPIVVADGAHPPFARGVAQRVLIDAPCSGLGSLRSRADARWRIDADAPARLAALQVELVKAGVELLAPGGTLVYSVCTLTAAESVGVLKSVLGQLPEAAVEVLDTPGPPWEFSDGVATLMPDTIDGATVNDAMMLFRLRRLG